MAGRGVAVVTGGASGIGLAIGVRRTSAITALQQNSCLLVHAAETGSINAISTERRYLIVKAVSGSVTA
jgi:NAD(P)-dependent dehydrogenase (short-subunit alcohol dehydrogenase family)